MSGIFFIFGACFLWAIDTLVRYPLISEGVSSLEIVTIEHVILTIFFSYFLIKKVVKIGEIKLAHLFYFFMVGVMGSAVATLSFTKAFTVMNPSVVILLQKFQPVLAIILARIVLKESIKKNFIIWATVCLVGGFLIGHEQVQELLKTQTNPLNLSTGMIWVLISIVGWASATVFGKKLVLEGYKELEIMAGRFLLGFLVLVPIYTKTHSLELPGSVSMLKIFIMVILSGVLAMFLYYQGLRRISARACALAETFFPFCAVVSNWIFLDKTLTFYQIVGGSILVVASSIIQIKRY